MITSRFATVDDIELIFGEVEIMNAEIFCCLSWHRDIGCNYLVNELATEILLVARQSIPCLCRRF